MIAVYSFIAATVAGGLGLALAMPTYASQGAAMALAGACIGGAMAIGVRRSQRWTATQDRLEALEAGFAQSQVAIAGLRDQVDFLSGRVESQPAESQEAISAELKVLQQLLAQVMSRQGAATQTEPKAPSANPKATPARPSAEVLRLIRSALEESRVDLYLQPVVRLPSRKTAHFEAFSRVRDDQGRMISPAEFLPAAESSGLAGTLDNLLMFRCVGLSRKLGPKRPGVRLFCNLAGASLSDPEFMDQFLVFLRTHRELSDRLVFELHAQDLSQFDEALVSRLSDIARLGFPFSIDGVERFDFERDALARMNVQFIKMDAQALLRQSGPIAAEDLKDYLARAKIELIATHIEDERTIVEVLDLGVNYGQGYLFGAPRPARLETDAAPTAKAA
jgi:cyclic-di-GMP phosphodiesterase, flagellum assembly factor TipF